MRLRSFSWFVSGAIAPCLSLVAHVARADATADALPPWQEAGEIPVPEWAHSVEPQRFDAALYEQPSAGAPRTGSALRGVNLPLLGARRGPGCSGTYYLVGPSAWLCSDVALPRLEPASVAPHRRTQNGLPYRYYFAGPNGATGFIHPEEAEEAGSDQELERGWSVAVEEEKTIRGERWGRTTHGKWFSLSELGLVAGFPFHGEAIEGEMTFAWVHANQANVFATDKGGKATTTRMRYERVTITAPANKAGLVAVTYGSSESGFMNARDLAIHKVAPPPKEVEGDERWIDVELASQTLVAYQGTKPVYATIVSTGKGPPASEFGTHLGVHRIWVKILSTRMSNIEKEDVEHPYYIEDVPYVQFFDKAIALHGAYWHKNFGHVQSHGCVNLAPIDAEWLFFFTGPHLPKGWRAAYPTPYEKGAVIRVR